MYYFHNIYKSLLHSQQMLHGSGLESQQPGPVNEIKTPLIKLNFYYYIIVGKECKLLFSEIDLGVVVDSKLAFFEHCIKVVKGANSTMQLIRRTFKSRRKYVIVRLYKALIRRKCLRGSMVNVHWYVDRCCTEGPSFDSRKSKQRVKSWI